MTYDDTPIDTSKYFTLGCYFSVATPDYYTGRMSKFRIGTGVATAQQVRNMFNFKTDNIYTMNIIDLNFAGTAANNVPDLSGNTLNGTLFNSANTLQTIY